MSVLSCVAHPVSCLTGSATSTLLSAVDSLVAGALPWTLAGVAAALDGASRFSSLAGAVAPLWRHLVVMSPLLTVVALVVTVLTRTLTGQLADVVRSLVLQCVVTALGLALAPWLLRTVGTVVDALSQWVLAGSFSTPTNLGRAVSVLFAVSSGPGGVIASVLVIVGALSLWCEIIVRNLALAVALCVLPLAAPWALTVVGRRIVVRIVELIAALLVSKLLTALTIAVGLSLIAHSQSLTTALSGALTLWVASMAPFIIWRLIPGVEGSAHQLAATWRAHAVRQVAQPNSTLWGTASRALAPRVDLSAPVESDPITPWPGEPSEELPTRDGPGPVPIGKARAYWGHHQVDGEGIARWHVEE